MRGLGIQNRPNPPYLGCYQIFSMSFYCMEHAFPHNFKPLIYFCEARQRCQVADLIGALLVNKSRNRGAACFKNLSKKRAFTVNSKSKRSGTLNRKFTEGFLLIVN